MAKSQGGSGVISTRPLALAGAGVACVLSALTIHGLWIVASYRHPEDHAARVSDFLSLFPAVLQQPARITILSVVLSVAAMACAVASRRRSTRSIRLTSVATIAVAGFILLLDVWQSM